MHILLFIDLFQLDGKSMPSLYIFGIKVIKIELVYTQGRRRTRLLIY